MLDPNVLTGFGGLDGQYSWISENSKEILGLTAKEILEHRPTITALPGSATYDQILAEEKERKHPRLTFRSWLLEVRNNDDVIPLAAVALFERDGNGELEKVVGAAWNCTEFCPTCSQTRSASPTLCRAASDLAQTAADSL